MLRISYSTKKLAREVYNEIDEDFFTTAIHKDFLEEHPEFKAFKPRFMFVEDEGYAMVVSR